MKDHPLIHNESTIVVEKQRQFGRVDYAPCNLMAAKFAEGFKQKGFTLSDLKFLQEMGYSVLIKEPLNIEYGYTELE